MPGLQKKAWWYDQPTMFIMRLNEEIERVRFLELSGKPTDEELEAYLAFEAGRVGSSASQDAVLILRLTDVWTATQRKRMRDFELEYAAKTTARQLGMAMVVPNALIRGAFTAYFWLAPAAYPTAAVPHAAAAYPFVTTCLQQAGLPVPAREEFELIANSEWRGQVVQPDGGLLPLAS